MIKGISTPLQLSVISSFGYALLFPLVIKLIRIVSRAARAFEKLQRKDKGRVGKENNGPVLALTQHHRPLGHHLALLRNRGMERCVRMTE